MKSEQMRVFARPVPNTLPNRCPTCAANANEPCRLASGQARHEPHFDRQIAADSDARKATEARSPSQTPDPAEE